ncbi:MAG: 3-hydroxybutyrate dehydrogenase [Bacteriovoracaceae bacterium]|nr:3-hydroxybutyrate dehydrogenase [Bacteriovoracaceae bacterium]
MKAAAVVTGASSGIGRAIAIALSEAGHKVVNWDLRAPLEADPRIPHVFCDVSSEAAVIKAAQDTHALVGDVGILINNSGLQFMAPLDEFPIEKWQQLIGVMLTGTFLCTKNLWPMMKKLNSGRVINISSVHGKLASPFKSAYVAAKHGVLGLAKVAAIEGAPFNITVNTICPGFVDTPLMRDQVKSQMELNKLSEQEVLERVFLKDQQIKKLTHPDQVAQFVLFLASDNASTITGEAFNISGGWGMGL